MKKPDGQYNFSLADFVAPADSGRIDYVGAFAVTAGPEVHAVADEYERKLDDYSSIIVKALGDRFAEAFAECMHKKARDMWGFGKTEGLSNEDFIREKYRGIRPAPGYPAQPDHTEKYAIWKLLDVEKNAGITLTESLAMYPGSSVRRALLRTPRGKVFRRRQVRPRPDRRLRGPQGNERGRDRTLAPVVAELRSRLELEPSLGGRITLWSSVASWH